MNKEAEEDIKSIMLDRGRRKELARTIKRCVEAIQYARESKDREEEAWYRRLLQLVYRNHDLQEYSFEDTLEVVTKYNLFKGLYANYYTPKGFKDDTGKTPEVCEKP